jgi:putative SOS response-associated peptidase YedK
MRSVHDRMPVILDPRHFGTWIDRTIQEPAALVPLLRPFDADRMRVYPVNPWVNDARHDDARCLEPAA